LFLFNHLQTVLIEALSRDTCNACRVPCILLNLPFCLAAQQAVALFNELWEQKLKKASITVYNNINTNITSQ